MLEKQSCVVRFWFKSWWDLKIRRLFYNRLSLKMFIEIWSTETTDLLGSKAGALKLELKDNIFLFLS